MIGISHLLSSYYEDHLRKYGDTARGAAWPDDAGRARRFQVGLEIMEKAAGGRPVTVCDLGCGTGELYRHIMETAPGAFRYIGVDISETALALARSKFPGVDFVHADVAREEDLGGLDCDFIFANGLFTVKSGATHQAMWQFMTGVLEKIWPKVRCGVIFNVMSKIVDWEREDLFHVSYDDLAAFLHGLAGRAIGFRADYGLYEIMAYALKPALPGGPAAESPGARGAIPGTIPGTIPGVIPVCRPVLPRAEHLLPYLEAIDRSRHYTNHGPLEGRLARRLADTMAAGVCLASCGTAGLLGAILAAAGRARPDRPVALCPGFTFVATAAAIEQAGYHLHLVDVDPQSWAVEPAAVAGHPMLNRVGLVVVAAPFGRAVPQEPWRAFSRHAGIPVVIDGAAAFEALCTAPDVHLGEIPVVLSLHATKPFSTAEGGAVVCRDGDLLQRVWGALNFGFLGSRQCGMASTNGKMSEYHAALGLAEIERWPAKRTAFQRVAQTYRREAEAAGLVDRIVTAPTIGSCYTLFAGASAAETQAVAASLDAAGIGQRRWYGQGLHREPYLRTVSRDALARTEHLADRLIGLPMAADLSAAEVIQVLAAVRDGMARA